MPVAIVRRLPIKYAFSKITYASASTMVPPPNPKPSPTVKPKT
jgi:hypothetical protein